MSTTMDSSTVEEAARQFEGADPLAVISWAVENFGDDIVMASSFQDAVLLEMTSKVAPDLEIIFLDTKFHFPETLAYMRHCQQIYDLNLKVLEPSVGIEEYPCGAEHCCDFRKVAPMNEYLATKSAWITGLKRVDTPERANAPPSSLPYDEASGLREDQPARHLGRRRRRRLRRQPQPALRHPLELRRVHLDRLRPNDAPRRSRGGPAGRTLGGYGQNRVWPPYLMVANSTEHLTRARPR